MATNAKELLEQLRAQQKQPQDARALLTQLRAANAPNVDSTPFELPPTQPARIFPDSLGKLQDRFSPEERELAQQGVDITSGSPVGRLQSGFAQNEALRAEDLRKRLSEHFGTEVQVQKGPKGLEFIHPETNRRTLVDESTFTLRDVKDIAGPAITTAGAVAGGIGGAMVGAPTVGAGVGGTIGEGIRRGIGTRMGVREEGFDDAAKGSLGVGALEAAAGKAGDLAMAGVQRARNFVRPQPLSADAAERALSAIQSDQAIAEAISAQTGQPFRPFTSQMSDDPILMGGQSSSLTSPASGPGLRAQQQQNETTLESLFTELNPTAEAPATATGRAIQVEARDQVQPRVEAARDSVEQNIDRLEEITRQLPAAENSTIVANLSREAAEGRRLLKQAEDTAWEDARQAMGFNPETALSDVQIPVTDDLAKTLNQLSAEARAALDPATAAGKRALVPEGIRPNDGKQSVFSEILPEIFPPQPGQPNRIDLNQLQVHLSALRRRMRIQRKGEVATDPQGRDLSRLEANLKSHRNEVLRRENPELLAKIEEAEAITRKRAELFDEGLVGQLIRKADGEWQLRDAELIGRTIGSGDKEAIEHLTSALSRHPAGVPTLQRSFLQFYRNEVVENGVPNAAQHKRFIERHGETLDTLFPGNSQIRQLGEFEKTVTRQVKRFTDFEKAVEKSFRGRIQNLAPERIAEDVLSKSFSVKDVGRLMHLAEAAGVKDQYQAAITGSIRRRFMSETSGLNLNAMSKFVEGNSERLATALGPQYVRDMRLLLRGLTTIRTSAGGIATTRNPTLIGSIAEGIGRATVARPLSAPGVALTRLFSFRQRAAQRMMARAIEDPKALHAIVSQRDSDIRNRSVARLLSMVGGSSLAIEQFEEE